MLRLLVAMKECGVKQKQLVVLSGFGKSMVSQVLNTGKLPINADKWRDGVNMLVNANESLTEWLLHNNLTVEGLSGAVGAPAVELAPPEKPIISPAAELDKLLCEIAGRAVLSGDGCNDMTIRLACTTSFLMRQLNNLMSGEEPWYGNNVTAVLAILKGDRP